MGVAGFDCSSSGAGDRSLVLEEGGDEDEDEELPLCVIFSLSL